MFAWVFGYASLVAVPEPGALQGRLHGYRRTWGVAMNNWQGGEEAKHFLERDTGERSHIRVAYLDLREQEGTSVNGVVLPVDANRLAALDAREINYERIDVSGAFESIGRPTPAAGSLRVLTYVGLDAARERCRQGVADGNVFVSRDYATGVRRAFAQLGPDALAEFDRTTDPLLFPEKELRMVQASSATGS